MMHIFFKNKKRDDCYLLNVKKRNKRLLMIAIREQSKSLKKRKKNKQTNAIHFLYVKIHQTKTQEVSIIKIKKKKDR